MKIRILIAALLAALAVAAGLQAQPAADTTPLGAEMQKISKSWKKVNTQVKDSAQNAATLAELAIVKASMEAALKFEPARKADTPAAEQAKFVADYQAKMKEEIAKVDQVIALVKAGKNADATALVTTIDQDQKDAHKAFKNQKKKAN